MQKTTAHGEPQTIAAARCLPCRLAVERRDADVHQRQQQVVARPGRRMRARRSKCVIEVRRSWRMSLVKHVTRLSSLTPPQTANMRARWSTCSPASSPSPDVALQWRR